MGLNTANNLDDALVEAFFDGGTATSTSYHSGNLAIGILQSGSEWAYSGYARQPVQRGTASGGIINLDNGSNSAQPINFPTVTGSSVQADEWGLYDTTNNTLLFSESAGNVTVNVGDYATIPAGSITLSVT